MQGTESKFFEEYNCEVNIFLTYVFPAGGAVLCKEGRGDSYSQSWRSSGSKHDIVALVLSASVI